MSDDEMGSEEEVDQTLTNSEVVVKYRAAGQVASSVIAKVVEATVDGKNVLELCELGDKLILEGVKNQYKTKKYEKGIAFPTCISVNNVAGHYSPEAGDKAVLKDGDVVKIDLGVHLDGFIAVAAHTHVVGNAQGKVTTGKAADAICAAHIAGEAILRLLKPGQKNTAIADVVKTITNTFHVTPVDAVLSHQMKRFVIDGTKVIPNKHVADQAVEEFEIEENEVYAIDVVVSTGSGKTRELDLRPTIYKRDVDQTYLLKLQAARKIFTEVNQKAPSLPFNIRILEEKHARFGLGELEKHGLIHPYPILYEREGEIVAQFKYTALVGPNGATRITQLPLPYVQSQYSVEDAEVKALLSQTVTAKKKKKSTKKAKVTKDDTTEAARCSVVAAAMGMDTTVVVGGGRPVVKAASDKRLYEVLKLPNGLSALLIHDPAMSGVQPEEDGGGACGHGACGHDHDEDEEDDEDYEEGEDDDDEDDEEDEDDHGMDVDGSRGVKRGHGHVHKACCSNGDCGEECEDSGEDGEEGLDDDDDEDGPSHGGAMQAPTKKAAAAMCVGVGSFSDPVDAQGLAHFLEHMLFMGSEKFPDENEYDNFLSKHGGGSNAFTDKEFTCYHFDVSPNHLQAALDRFSQFFIAPLAKPETMDREVQAIDSEFEQVLQSDACRLLQLQCHTAKPNHPFRSFSWGNKKSLSEPMERGVDMRGKLLQLYKDHYLASRMKLTVLGGESLETLKTWVLGSFGKVKEGGLTPLKFPWDGPVWEPGSFYRVESVKDQHLLSLTWPFPCLEASYLKRPQDYISHLVGHEGAGSLLSLLKERGWATALSAGVEDGGYGHSSAGYMFSVNIWLTDSGLEHVLDAVEMFYQYVKMLRTTGPQKWVFEELQAMGMMEFRFAEEESADQYVVRLASNMHLYPEEHAIYGDYAFEEWDPVLVADLIDRVNPYNMRLDLVTKNFDRNSTGVQFEPWFEVPYTVEMISDEILQRWADPKHVDLALQMPVVNAFIPHDFTIRTGKPDILEGPDVPRVLLDEPGLKVWYKLDRTFSTPRANTYFSVTCKAASESIRSIVLTEIYVKLLEHELNETIYLANVAKLESSMTFSGDKLDLKIYGFNEKLPVLASKCAELLTSLVAREDRFQVIKEELERGYRNTNMKPLKHSAYLRLQALKERFWHVDDKLACLLTLSVSDVAEHIPHLFSETYIEALCHGNLYEDEALGIANIFKQSLVKNALPADSRPIERIVKLDPSSALLYTADVKNEAEENSVVEMYFQLEKDLGKNSLRIRSLMDLFERMIQEPCFNQLRTKEQLGYRVDCGVRVTFKVLGFCFRVQSAKYSPVYLEQRINAFVTSLSKILDDVQDDEFNNYKEALIEEKLERDHSLIDETDRHWEQIWDQRYLFEARKEEAAEIMTFEKKEVFDFFTKYFGTSSPSRRKLSIHIWGGNAKGEKEHEGVDSLKDLTVIDDLSTFKAKKELYQ